MINYAATRQNLKQWVQSSAFDEQVKASFPLPKKRFIVGAILTVTPIFPFGIRMLIRAFRVKSSQKKLRQQFKSEASQWEPILCGVVITNSQALRTPGSQSPSALLGSFGAVDDQYLSELFSVLEETGDLYGADPAEVLPQHREFTTLINDDVYQDQRRRRLPAHLAGSRGFQLFDAILNSNYFPNNQIDSPFVVCAGHPLRQSSFVHLPAEVVVWEEREASPAEPYNPNIIRHTAPTEEPPIVAPVSENLEHLETHIEQYFGEPELVFHEVVSTTVHIDLHLIPATEERPWNTIVTTGMSDIPMTTPEGMEEFKLAELLLRLPPSWPLKQEDFADETVYWPLRQLKFLARFAHEYQTWLCYGHTIPNGDPPEPFAEGVPFAGVLLSHPYWAAEEAARCTLPDGHVVNFWSLNFLFESEMSFKLENGADALIDKLIEQGFGDFVETRREPVC